MNWVFISIIAVTVLQLIATKGIKWAFISYLVMLIVRVMFLLRMQGIVFKTKPLWITEAFIVGMQFVLCTLFKDTANWLAFALYIVFTLIVIAIEFIDDKFYIYTVEDDKED